MGHLTIKFNGIKFNSLRLLASWSSDEGTLLLQQELQSTLTATPNLL